MKIIRINPNAKVVVKARTSFNAGLIYANRISRLDECRHLAGNDPVTFHVKMNILVDLIHPNNILRQHFDVMFSDKSNHSQN